MKRLTILLMKGFAVALLIAIIIQGVGIYYTAIPYPILFVISTIYSSIGAYLAIHEH